MGNRCLAGLRTNGVELAVHLLQQKVKRLPGWIRAGHEPALLYDPRKERFEKLDGKGMALGVVEAYTFDVCSRQGWTPGSIILISTDGISETRNSEGEMFGEGRIRQTLFQNAKLPAAQIEAALLKAVKAHRGDMPQDDDITSVVIKLM